MNHLSPPAWVRKRDGQLVPFEADKISRALFAATEALGRPDAFLARELADGIVHFLCDENDDATPTTADIAELVIKVVRELGQPALAEAFAAFGQQRERGPRRKLTPAREEVVLRFPRGEGLPRILAACARQYTLQSVYTRDLISAQENGLLTLTGHRFPEELEACVLNPHTAPALLRGDLPSALQEVRSIAGGRIVLDGPEHFLARAGQEAQEQVREFAHRLEAGLAEQRLTAVVNLNTATPPSWADDLAVGPLFENRRYAPAEGDLFRLAQSLFQVLAPARGVRIDWHLGERDFLPESNERRSWLRHLIEQALNDARRLSFVFDRSRHAVRLAEGIDRQHPAVLLTVGLHLPRLVQLAGGDDDRERFLHKLGSLTRLALSAGVQKRAYLRSRERGRASNSSDTPVVTSGFLLDRARLVVAPVGLDRVVTTFTGQGLSAGGESLDFGKQVIQRLLEILHEGQSSRLNACLDGLYGFHLEEPENGEPCVEPRGIAGLSAWDTMAPVKDQWRAAGVLQGLAEGGTLALFLPPDRAAPDQVASWLRAIWKQTEVVRVRLMCGSHR
ncbi:MAG TPA: ATP cone domain-containing protein [Gemmataceae bacterium]|nr:ATP cone domain-containing protein [Gemmataceae bacterium]